MLGLGREGDSSIRLCCGALGTKQPLLMYIMCI